MRLDKHWLPFFFLSIVLFIKLCTICMLCLIVSVPRQQPSHYEQLVLRNHKAAIMMLEKKNRHKTFRV